MIKQLIPFIFLVMGILFNNSAFAWYDSNAAGTAPDWSYRVPITIPAATAVNSTITFDVNFNALLSTLGDAGTFDINSPRIVRPDESLAGIQEFTDRIFNGVIDAASNGRGEVKFILQDAGPTTYYLYFDTTANGPKPANAQPPINGNLEHSVGATPTSWTNDNSLANGNETNAVFDTAFAATFTQVGATTCSDQVISNIDNSPNNNGSAANVTGRKWHLLGYRQNCEDGDAGNSEEVNLSRSISVPASNPGNLTFFFQVQAFDSWNGTTNYDHVNVSVNGTLVNHTSLGIANPGGLLTISNTGIGRANPFSAALVDSGWQQATLNLSPYAGTNITFEITADSFTDNGYRSWVKLDDIEWSIRTATLGIPEAQPPIISLQKTSMVISDGINATNPKRIPSAVVEYTLTAVNSGAGKATDDTIIINDTIPANSSYIVNSLAFIDGTPASGLSTTPVAPAASILLFSTDGVAFNTTQSTAVSHIRVHPSGEFLGVSGAGNPSFQVVFRVTLD
jgi:uncharacterized repeat protein (TIGR01451 family)